MAMLFSVLIIITCILLVIIVLVQNPKGGGLSSSFGGSGTQLFGGVKKTTDFLDRGTWALAIVLVVLVLLANVTLSPTDGIDVEQQTELNDVTTEQPAAPISQPVNPGLQDMPQSVDQDGDE